MLILVSSVIVDGPDKGFADLRDALRAVARPGVGVVAIGRLDDQAKLGIDNLVAPGLIASEEELAAWYGACDLHVTASRHENPRPDADRGRTVRRADPRLRTSGLTTSVIDGVSGRLVEMRPGALAEALSETRDERTGADGARRLRTDRTGESFQLPRPPPCLSTRSCASAG